MSHEIVCEEMENTTDTIGIRIRDLRKQKGMTQQELADKLNIMRENINYYESNRRQPKIQDIINMAEFFNVSTDYILSRTINKTEQKITFDGSKIRINEKDITGFVREHSLIMKIEEMPYLKLVLEIPVQSRNLRTSADVNTSFIVDVVDCDK